MNKAIGLLIAAMLALTGCKASSQVLPLLTGRVVDQANLLDLESEKALNDKLESTERLFGPQLVVVTVKSLGGKSIEDFGLILANSWGIGNKERSDGMLLLVAPTERRVSIEVGYGLERLFTNEVCQAIIDDTILPNFVEGRMQDGIINAVDQIVAKMKPAKMTHLNDNSPSITLEDAA